jgi:hypothetical protein
MNCELMRTNDEKMLVQIDTPNLNKKACFKI